MNPIPSNPEPETANPPSRRNGKVAKLPRPVRDQINQMLSDGCSYRAILDALQFPGPEPAQHSNTPSLHHSASSAPPLPYALSEQNLSNWFQGGYQDWLRDQERLAQTQAAFELAADLVQNSAPEKLHDLILRLASLRICEFLVQFDLTNLQTSFASDPRSLCRLVSALTRLTREAITIRKHRDEFADDFYDTEDTAEDTAAADPRDTASDPENPAAAPSAAVTGETPLPPEPSPHDPCRRRREESSV